MENRINQQTSAYENLKGKTAKMEKEIENKKNRIEELLIENKQILGEQSKEKDA